MSRLPAEWEHQSGVQLTWPHCETEWYELEKVLECYVEIAYNILRFEPLMIVMPTLTIRLRRLLQIR